MSWLDKQARTTCWLFWPILGLGITDISRWANRTKRYHEQIKFHHAFNQYPHFTVRQRFRNIISKLIQGHSHRVTCTRDMLVAGRGLDVAWNITQQDLLNIVIYDHCRQALLLEVPVFLSTHHLQLYECRKDQVNVCMSVRTYTQYVGVVYENSKATSAWI